MKNSVTQKWSYFWLNFVLFTGLILVNVNSYAAYDRTTVMELVQQEAQKQGVDPALALAIAHIESNFDSHAISSKGARGVMQIMPKTARDEFGLNPALLFDPQTNIHTGIKFIKQLTEQYGRVDYALSHYNGGSRVRGRDGNLRVIPETRSYVNKVLEKAAYYRRKGVRTTLSPTNSEVNYRYRDAQNRAKDLERLRQKNMHLAKVIGFWVEPYLSSYQQTKVKKFQVKNNLEKRQQVREWESIYNN